MPGLYVITSGAYEKYDDDTAAWVNKGAPPTSSSNFLRFFQSGRMFHLTGRSVSGGTAFTGDLVRSLDSGETWETLAVPDDAHPTASTAVCAGFDMDIIGRLWTVWIDSNGSSLRSRILRSDDNGDTWDLVYTMPSNFWRIHGIACHPADSSKVAITFDKIVGSYVMATTDDGATWSGPGSSPSLGSLQAGSPWLPIWASSDNDDIAVLGVRVAGTRLHKTSDYGLSFSTVVTTSLGALGGFERSGPNGAIFVMTGSTGSSTQAMWRSIDGAASFETWPRLVNPYDGVHSVIPGALAVGPVTDSIYVWDLETSGPAPRRVWQRDEAYTAELSDDSDLQWVDLDSPGSAIGQRWNMALIDEGLAPIRDHFNDPNFDPAPAFDPTAPYPTAGTPGYGVLPKGKSRIFDGEVYGLCDATGETGLVEGAQPELISLVDRAPPGRYVVVRSSTYSYDAYIQTAAALGLRGIIFLLGDTEDPAVNDYRGGPDTPTPYISRALRWQPDPTGKPWQINQWYMDLDQIQPDETGHVNVQGCDIAGPISARQHRLVVGGLFKCGQAAFERPAQAAGMIASTKNRLNLDIVLIDIDQQLDDGSAVWNQSGARDKVLTLAGHVQQRYTRPQRSPRTPEISSHTPTFFVLPPKPFEGTTQLYPNLLSGPESPANDAGHTVSDDSNLFPPLQKNYTAPVTFPMPRVPATGNQSDLYNGWQWAKPGRLLGIRKSLTHCFFMFDMRNGGDPTGMINQAGTDNGLVVKFNNQPYNYSVRSGILVYDDFDALMSTGAGGADPDSHWDMDNLTPNGAYVPAFHPDPPPIGIVDETYETWVDSRGRTISPEEADALNSNEAGSAYQKPLVLWFENWKNGHLARERGTSIQNYLPNYWQLTDKVCSNTRSAIPSWIKINGSWATPIGGPNNFYGFTNENGGRITFSGTPRDGDEGVYAVDVLAARSIFLNTETSVPIIIGVVNPPRMEDVQQSSTGIPLPQVDIGARRPTDDYKDGSHLHSEVPVVEFTDIGIGATHAAFGSNFCAGSDLVVPALPLDPLGTGEIPSDATICGANYVGDLVVAADQYCENNFITLAQSLVCGIGGFRTLYLTFVLAMARALSGFDPHFDDGCRVGLFAIKSSECGGTYPRADLLDPAFNFNVVADDLQNAFMDTAPRSIGGKACPASAGRPDFSDAERVMHAAIAYMDYSGYAPGVHGNETSFGDSFSGVGFHDSFPCWTTVSDPVAQPVLTSVQSNWKCYNDNLRAGGLPTPGRDSGTGQAGPTGSSGGTTTEPAPTGSYVPGCPVSNSSGYLSWDCTQHLANEGIPAIDIAINPSATVPLLSPCDGTVIFRGQNSNPKGCFATGLSGPYQTGLGCEVRIQCDSGLIFRYGHMPVNYCTDGPGAGTRVNVGTQVGQVGTTGCSTGPHVHVEVFQGGDLGVGTRICPLNVLPAGCP